MLTHFLRRVALLTLCCAAWGTAHAQVAISQVYGGGGNSGATYKNDFVELRNRGDSAVDVSGWSIQYASASGSTWQRANLAGSIPAGGFYLIQLAAGSGGTTDLPAPDASGGIPMSSTAGKVALVSSQNTLSGACPLGGAMVDFVGFGSANCSETAPAPAPSNTRAIARRNDGVSDTDNNSVDFLTADPTPRNSSNAPPPPPQPPLPLTIAQIQGNGLLSPHDGKRVVTEGIVTARRFNNGFFLQAANDDGDAATSDGIFVFTGSAPPAEASVGNLVRVIGKVEEYIPASNPSQLSVTELVQPTVELLQANQALPAPVEIPAALMVPGAAPGVLEHLEGMRVSVAQARVVQASLGTIDENDALSFTNGIFQVVLPQAPRPFREPGIGVLDVIPIPADKNPPRFDLNAERLNVASRAQIGASPLAIDVDTTVTGLVGVLDYSNATWSLAPDPDAPITLAGGKTAQAVSDAGEHSVTIGGFNLLRFFDEVNDSNGAVTLTPEALEKRLAKTSAAICDYLKTPDILGVVEVENTRVLGMLAARINANCPSQPAYRARLLQGNDVGGINVGFLLSERAAGANPRVEAIAVEQYGKDAVLTNPDGSTSLLNDRPPLVVRARVHHANGGSYPVMVIVNHLRSLNDMDSIDPGSNGWSTVGARVRAKRAAQAAYLAGLVESFQNADPAQKIVLVGDFNAFEFNDGYVDVMGIVRGDPAPEDQVLTYVDSPLTTPLIDGSDLIANPAERYSYVFGGNTQTLDHVLVNEALILDATGASVEHARINADFGVHHFGNAASPLRVSDHDPVRLAIQVPQFLSADLVMRASASRLAIRVGGWVAFTAQVRNAGPDAASAVGVALVFDGLVAPQVLAPNGWTCAAAVQDTQDNTTSVSCSTPAMAANAQAGFTALLSAGPALSGRTLRMAAAAASQTRDPIAGNNRAAARVAVLPAAGPAVGRIAQP